MTRTQPRPTCILTAIALLASIAHGGIHIDSGRKVAWNWVLDDGAGYRWDITSYGTVNDGTDDAYDGAMQLTVDGQAFSYGRPGVISQEARETETGPWRHGDLYVYRRIYVDDELGYCRWIDIFENGSNGPVSAKVLYAGNLGGTVRTVRTSSGGDRPAPGDWAMVTADVSQDRPAIVHIFAGPGGRVRPDVRVAAGGRDVSYETHLEVPAQSSVALCFFHAQRRPFTEAEEMLEGFSPGKELAKVPPDLRRLIVNMGAPLMTLGGLDLPRHDQHDLVVLDSGSELLGSLGATSFTLRTFHGELTLPASRVVGLSVVSPGHRLVRAALTDGQVIAGTIVDDAIAIELAAGGSMSVALDRLRFASYRVSADRPAKAPAGGWLVELRDGQRLSLRKEPPVVNFVTRHGIVALRPGDVSVVELDVSDGGLHETVFRNGSRLSGLVDEQHLSLVLALGGEVDVPRTRLRRLQNADHPPTVNGEPVSFLLRNGDRLHGRLGSPWLPVSTPSGEVAVRLGRVVRVEFRGDRPDAVRVTLRDGSLLDGRLATESLMLRVNPNVSLQIHPGHLERIEFDESGESRSTGSQGE